MGSTFCGWMSLPFPRTVKLLLLKVFESFDLRLGKVLIETTLLGKIELIHVQSVIV